MARVKTQVIFPEELLQEVDRVVKKRERSDFVIEAVEEKLRRIRLQKLLNKVAGVWKDRADMKTNADVNRFLRSLRKSDMRREKRIKKAWRDG